MKAFNLDKLRPGLILHCRNEGPFFGSGFYGKMIRAVLKSWGNHDALTVMDDNIVAIGDTVWPRSKVASLDSYEELMNKGLYKVRVYQVTDATQEQEIQAAKWWMQNVYGMPYDAIAFPSLLMLMILNRLPFEAGVEGKFFCSEGVAKAWKYGGMIDWAHKKNTTPRTTEKRLASGELRDVTGVMIHDVLQPRAGRGADTL